MQISIRNLKKFYNDKLILDIEHLNFPNGKITGLVGPNGAGKSTLLNIISGLDQRYSGSVRYDNKNLDEDVLKKMTLVFQKSYLLRRSVYENIEYPLKIRGIPKSQREKEVEDILKKLGIAELRNKKAHLLSGGESQKVAFARALIFKPQILLLDEPASNIDSDTVEDFERQIINFNREIGATVVMITHNTRQAKRICDKVIYLKNGRVDRPNEIFKSAFGE
ncbi:MAG: tungstate transport system ATP-binding protein [Petroclostridium sp.]|uniref:ABC transporter ATP-binding protein n=1 Tax=Petroclostridium xylanilyticum TaxID=1792311 RepID=UPI000B97D085|nr:ATP-binding cassette domain-containing protein [Petroclostridium xylanilyticum]MDK2809505.1 tungstate transport system ATP-binding protein [Petroclostridium sp.]